MTTATKNVTWVSKVMGLLNLSEEGQVGLMYEQLVKLLKKQIKERKDLINKVQEQTASKLEDLSEELNEIKDQSELAFITVDVDRIKSLADRQNYSRDLNKAFDEALEVVSAKEREIESLKERTKATIEAYEKEIARFELKLSKLMVN